MVDFKIINVRENLSMSPYLGYLFEKEINESELHDDEKKSNKKGVSILLQNLLSNCKKKLPENLKLLKNSMALSVSVILKPNRLLNNFVQVLERLGYTEKIDTVIQHWQSIILQKWKKTEDTVKFWAKVQESNAMMHLGTVHIKTYLTSRRK
ncbi:unnamed protein product [Euphydryas editha]|uniref:Uncharacterized protein n=1 Tax=Euphydryas editha TaxID=104508 RepID=A0AAU9TVJ8_EUPED|nr:unnamed protein product [Euphydryas editha]